MTSLKFNLSLRRKVFVKKNRVAKLERRIRGLGEQMKKALEVHEAEQTQQSADALLSLDKLRDEQKDKLANARIALAVAESNLKRLLK